LLSVFVLRGVRGPLSSALRSGGRSLAPKISRGVPNLYNKVNRLAYG